MRGCELCNGTGVKVVQRVAGCRLACRVFWRGRGCDRACGSCRHVGRNREAGMIARDLVVGSTFTGWPRPGAG